VASLIKLFQIHLGVEQKVSLESSHSCNVNQFVHAPSRLRTFAIAPFGHSFLSLTICDGERWRAAHQREEVQRL
jgi:hypothetical protein